MSTLLSKLRALEIELHHPGARCSRERLEQILHAEFHEVGRSGREYDKATVVAFLESQAAHPAVESGEFKIVQLGPAQALLTYRSAHRRSDGTLTSHTLRASVWIRESSVWQLRYHQGTPAASVW